MQEILLKIVPIILIFVLGIVLKKVKVFTKENADLFLKLVFYVAAPALILTSVTKIELSIDFIFLPITASSIIITIYFISKFIGGLYNLPQATFGTFLVGSMIMNMGFALPFIIAAYGDEGLGRAFLFDFGNALLVFSFVYYCACKYGESSNDSTILMKKVLCAPPSWALIIGIILNLVNVEFPALCTNFLQSLGNIAIPMIMLSAGIHFAPKLVKIREVFSVIAIRMFIGLLLGFVFVYLFNLEGLSKIIVLIGASAPAGCNTLTFASLENLDREFAASLVSYSFLIGIIFTPFLIFTLS